MSVNVLVLGADKESDEYQAAQKMKKIIQDSLSSSVIGEIVIFASATLLGQAVKDIDLLMIGQLHNCFVRADFYSEGEGTIKGDVEITSFCTTIEVKRHDISGIFLNGTDFYVKYGLRNHCVTLQSNKKKLPRWSFLKELCLYLRMLQMLFGLRKLRVVI